MIFNAIMIDFSNVSRTFDGGRSLAVRDLSLHVELGELLVLLGESGCGKTTTLKMVNRLIEPSRGRVCVDDEDVSIRDILSLRRSIGYVFQGIGLFPHMTVAQNIAIVPHLLGWAKSDIDVRINELLELLHMPASEFADRLPDSLSGGQKQRIGVARALAGRPRTMLMDEPFGALDPLTRDHLQREFLTIHKQLNLTTLMVTHDMTEALLMADRIAVMAGGAVVQLGTPHELLTRPADEFVQGLMQTPRDQAARVEDLIHKTSNTAS